MTARILLSFLLIVSGLALSACAGSSRPLPTYQQELDQLTAECRERGGVLSSTGALTGRPQTEYACQIRGPASRIQN